MNRDGARLFDFTERYQRDRRTRTAELTEQPESGDDAGEAGKPEPLTKGELRDMLKRDGKISEKENK
jgi:hypothetical protein